jgi:exodeoxyribonuclease VII small subunit
VTKPARAAPHLRGAERYARKRVEAWGGPGRGSAGEAGAVGELPFEEARAELERIVGQLERGETGLEEAIALWERGEELYRRCVAKLDAAQARIEELGRELAEREPEAS